MMCTFKTLFDVLSLHLFTLSISLSLLHSSFFTLLPFRLFPSAGELDDIPEVAFYMVGPIEDVLQVAEKLAQQQQ